MQPDDNTTDQNLSPSNDSREGSATHSANDAAAINLIRQKLNTFYDNEPSSKEELKEAEENRPHSKHQDYILSLRSSGKSLAEVQTAWHAYYEALPDHEKHEVWQEFYAAHNRTSHYARSFAHPETTHQAATYTPPVTPSPRPQKRLTASDLKQQLLGKINQNTRHKAKTHLKSLGFGLMMGSLSLLVLLFGFFNERFIAPFITPSKAVSSTPIILDPNNDTASPDPTLIIPKINVEIPVVYDEPSIEEKAVDKALERGVVHYATTPNPGELGNAVIFGHSSNNILNPGKYKFAFVLLNRLETGDTFVLTHGSKRFVYKVYDKKIVKPDQVSVLETATKPATATLITCDPPGTSLNRLVVTAEQISPDPVTNAASTAKKADKQPTTLLSNAPSLWERFKNWLIH